MPRLQKIAIAFLLLNLGCHALAQQSPREKLAEVRNDYRDNLSKLAELGQKQDNLKVQLKRFRAEIKTIKREQSKLTKSLEKLNIALQEQHQSQEALDTSIAKQQLVINNLLQQAWRQTPTVSWRSFLSPTHPDQIARQTSWLQYIVQSRRKEVAKFGELQEQQSKLIQHTQENQNEQTIQSDQLNKRSLELATIQSDIKLKQAEQKDVISNLRLEQRRIIREGGALQRLLRNLAGRPEGLGTVPPFREDQLSWPVRGRILHAYGAKEKTIDISWGGIVIASEATGVDVKATYPGQVVSIRRVKGWGLVVIVDHGNRYKSIYGYNKSATVAIGDFVEAGEVLARLPKPADYKKVKPIYFAVFKEGEPINPTKLLVSR